MDGGGDSAAEPSMSQSDRQRKRSSTSTPPFPISDLCDNLLIEVLHSLPCHKSAFRCKLVSKRWNSLISSQLFYYRFSPLQVNRPVPLQFTFIIYSYLNYLNQSSFFVTSKDPVFQSPAFKFEKMAASFQFSNGQKTENSFLLASFNDLFLFCENKYNSPHVFYTYNPLTCHCLAIPPPPKQYESTTRILLGVYYEPLRRQHRIVRIPEIQGCLHAEIFYSEKNQWKELDESCHPQDFRWHGEAYSTNAVPFNGFLHWVTLKKIFAYSPFHFKKCFVIDCPIVQSKDSHQKTLCCIGVFQGSFLRLMQMTIFPPHSHSHVLKVWDLEDYESRKWKLRHKVYLKKMVTEKLWIKHRLKQLPYVWPLAIHPVEDIVYVHMSSKIVLYDLKTREVTFADDEISFTGEQTSPNFDSSNGFPHSIPARSIVNIFPFVIPSWPTPVPALPNIGSGIEFP